MLTDVRDLRGVLFFYLLGDDGSLSHSRAGDEERVCDGLALELLGSADQGPEVRDLEDFGCCSCRRRRSCDLLRSSLQDDLFQARQVSHLDVQVARQRFRSNGAPIVAGEREARIPLAQVGGLGMVVISA